MARSIIVVLPGAKYGRLTVAREIDPIRSHKLTRRRFECLCECGATAVVELYNLRKGLTKSCGCWRRENGVLEGTTHGDSGSIEHQTWGRMISRCLDQNNKSWADYGGRGITVCAEWIDDYAAFRAHIGSRPGAGYSIERIENNLGYQPGNVKWATRRQQNRNKRNSIFVYHCGIQRLLVEVCEETGFPYGRAKRRKYLGWPDAHLFKP